MSRRDQLFESVTTEGALLPSDFLNRLAQRDREIPGLTPDAYHLGSGEKLNEAISRSWNRVLGVWKSFAPAMQALPASDAGTTLTREKWLLPLFQELGYGRLQTAKPFEFEGRRYSITHAWLNLPIHLVSFRADLDARSENIVGARTTSPHSMVQEFLNRSTPHVWGIVTNGLRLRLLRDNVSLTRQAFVEFDLQSMMQGELYADFSLLWLLLHQSRVEGERAELCWLEKWTQEARQRGTRALAQLRDGVEETITALGSGFLAHPANTTLRDKLTGGTLSKQDYFRQLLRVVYRFLFLFAAEDRELLFAENVPTKARENYVRHYSISRLRRIANRLGGTQHADLWHNVRLLFTWLGSNTGCPSLGLPALGSFLWSARATPDLDDCLIANRDLLIAVRALAFTEQNKVRRAIDYKNIGTEELGSVYESLLEQHPDVHIPTAKFVLGTHAGNERKTSGSHYTPPPLVNCLLDSALDPVLQERERDFAKLGFKSAEEAILSLKVCDTAVGSGHFLISAAHRIAKRLAAVRTGEGEPPPAAVRHALRDVIGRCLYGVDINAMAVELCKFALWLEALEPGKPLSFLDHHIQCGNSLLGATPALMAQGIPDAAFEPIDGDDKNYCSNFKKENRKEAASIHGLSQGALFDREDRPWERLGNLAINIAQIASLPDDRLEDVQAKEQRYADLVRSTGYEFGRQLADTWCGAFVWKKRPTIASGFDYPITNEVFRRLERNPHDAPKWMRDEIKRLADQYQFFHWHLAFPDVFQVLPGNQKPQNELCGWNGGFDVILGNPPWEVLEDEEKKFFAKARPDISDAETAERKILIEQLENEPSGLFAQWVQFRDERTRFKHFHRASGNYPLSSYKKLNLYASMLENGIHLLGRSGYLGLVLQSGLATDESRRFLFQELFDSTRLRSFLDFENSEGLFLGVHPQQKFSLVTVSQKPSAQPARFSFYNTSVEHLFDDDRSFFMSADDMKRLSPNTGSCPTFRNRRDAALVLEIYKRAPVFHNEANPPSWKLDFMQMFNSSSDNKHFKKTVDLPLDREARELVAEQSTEDWLPVFEGKFVDHFNHRLATFHGCSRSDILAGSEREHRHLELQNPLLVVLPRWWASNRMVLARLEDRGPNQWLFGFCDIANPQNTRTACGTIIPRSGVSDTIWLLVGEEPPRFVVALCAAVNSFVLDFIARRRIGSRHLKQFVFKQLPFPEKSKFAENCPWDSGESMSAWLLPRVLELTYTAWDLEAFARDCGWSGPPFRWEVARRFLLRCELDAAFFHLYGLNRDDAAYILDTFPTVKKNDEKEFGDYRTKVIILKIYDAMKSAMDSVQLYQTLLDPPPADPRCCHPPKSTPAKLELPKGKRLPAPNPQVYLMQLTILLVHRNGGSMSLDRMLDACALISLPDMLADQAFTEFGEAAKVWRSRFAEKIQPSLFLPILRDFIDRGVIRLQREGSGTLVVLADASAVPKNDEVEFDAGLALTAVKAMAMPELEALPEIVPDEELEEFCKVA
jgi:hypothetical protein